MKEKKLYVFILYACLILFFITSILSVYSAESIMPKIYNGLYIKQIIWYILGVITTFVVTKIGNEKILRYSNILYFIALLLLIFVLIFGNQINNTKGWINLGTFSFQPSEFMKLALILKISSILYEFHFKEIRNIKAEFNLLLKIFIVTLIPSVFTFIEPDTGAVISYFVIAFIMIFISGIKLRWFIIIAFIIFLTLFALLLIYMNYPNIFIKVFGSDFYYRIHRLTDWSNTSGLQLENSMIAISTAGLFGHGFNRVPIYFPESYSDFIFTIHTSNFGFIGALILIVIIIIFDYFIIKIALNSSKTINKYIVSGIIATFIYAQIQNISMTIGILPITGIPLNFISYGGSSLIISFTMIGLIINTYKEKNWYNLKVKHQPIHFKYHKYSN